MKQLRIKCQAQVTNSDSMIYNLFTHPMSYQFSESHHPIPAENISFQDARFNKGITKCLRKDLLIIMMSLCLQTTPPHLTSRFISLLISDIMMWSSWSPSQTAPPRFWTFLLALLLKLAQEPNVGILVALRFELTVIQEVSQSLNDCTTIDLHPVQHDLVLVMWAPHPL